MSLAKVAFMKIGKNTSLWTMWLCGSMLPHNHIVHNDLLLPI